MSETQERTDQRYSQPRVGRQGYRVSEDALAMWHEIRRLGLEANIAELDTLGYTVVPPEKAAPAGFGERLKDAVLDVVVRRGRIRPDLLEGLEYRNPPVPFGDKFAYLLFENPVFQEAVCNPVVDCLVTYLLGRSAVLSNCLAFLKGPGEEDLALHADHVYVPAPFPAQADVCNATWALTDYDRDNGALCFVPGSHTLGRHPETGDGLDERVAVDAPAGPCCFGTAPPGTVRLPDAGPACVSTSSTPSCACTCVRRNPTARTSRRRSWRPTRRSSPHAWVSTCTTAGRKKAPTTRNSAAHPPPSIAGTDPSCLLPWERPPGRDGVVGESNRGREAAPTATAPPERTAP